MTEPQCLPRLESVTTDLDRAKALESRARTILNEFLKLASEADQQGLIVTFQLGRDQFGRHAILNLSVMKALV